MMLQKKLSPAKRKLAPVAAMLVSFLLVGGVAQAQNAKQKTATKNAKSQSGEPAVYNVVDEMPESSVDLVQYLSKSIVYPEAAQKKKIEGKVIVKFVVGKDGSIKDVEAVRSPNELLTKEAIRVVSSMPKWKPGKQKGKEVAVYFTLPIMFKLG